MCPLCYRAPVILGWVFIFDPLVKPISISWLDVQCFLFLFLKHFFNHISVTIASVKMHLDHPLWRWQPDGKERMKVVGYMINNCIP